MIRVTIDLDSAISTKRDRRQATIEISNIGGGRTRGNYRYTIRGKGDQVIAEGEITNFPRKRGLAIDLVGLVLLDARGEKWLLH